MKNSILILSSLLISSLLFTGCLSTGEKKMDTEKELVEAKNALELAKKVYQEDVNAYKTANGKIIENNWGRIAELKSQNVKEKEATRVSNLKKIVELERQNNILNNKLFDYQDTVGSKWKSFKSEFMKELDILSSEIADFPKK